jgi:hypothetical protein
MTSKAAALSYDLSTIIHVGGLACDRVAYCPGAKAYENNPTGPLDTTNWLVSDQLYINTRQVKLALDGKTAIGSSFMWRCTPQGHQYWAARAGREKNLSEEDKKFLQSLLHVTPEDPKVESDF